MRMVKRNGKYGIEKGRFFKKYLDFQFEALKWRRKSSVLFDNCWIEDREEVVKIFYHITAEITSCDITELEKTLK